MEGLKGFALAAALAATPASFAQGGAPAAPATSATSAASAEPRANHFGDPFFQVSSAIRDCPLPLGPFYTESERRQQAHHRAEKGTTCWLAGQCAKPNYHLYDPEIAKAFQSAAAAQPTLFEGTSLWVTVQGRLVFVEGCAATPAVIPRLEAFTRALPDVQQAYVNVRTDPAGRPPYQVWP